MQNFGSYPMASGGVPSMMGMGAASSGAAGAGPKMAGPMDWNSMLRMVAGQRSLPGSGTTDGVAFTPGIMGGPAQNQVGPSPRGTVFNYEGGMGRMPQMGVPQMGMPQMGIPQVGRPQMPQLGPGQPPQNRPSGASASAPVGNQTNPNSLNARMAAQRQQEASSNEAAYQNHPTSSPNDSQYDQQIRVMGQQMGGGFGPGASQSRLLNQSGPGAAYQGMAAMGLPQSAIDAQNAMYASVRNGSYQPPQAYRHPDMNQNHLGAAATMMPFQMVQGLHRGSIPVMGQLGRWTNG